MKYWLVMKRLSAVLVLPVLLSLMGCVSALPATVACSGAVTGPQLACPHGYTFAYAFAHLDAHTNAHRNADTGAHAAMEF